MSIESVMPSSHLILCHPVLLPPIPPNIRVFSNESTLRMRWPQYWSFSLSIIPSKEIPGLMIFRMDWLDLLALLQHRSSKASILRRSLIVASQVALVVKNPPVSAGDVRDAVSIPGLGRSPAGGHGNPLQFSCLENPMDGGV